MSLIKIAASASAERSVRKVVTMTGFAVIAVGVLVTAAIAGDLPKEGTWRGKAAVEGKWTMNKIGTDETTGLIVFDQTSTMEGDGPKATETALAS